MGLEFESSDKEAAQNKRVKIEKGYYLGKLVSMAPRQSADGTPIEGKYGKQAIMVFAIYDKKTKNPITIQDGNVTKDVELASVVNVSYKDKKTNAETTAFTPNSRVTTIFKALGWSGPPSKVIVDEYIKKRFVEVLVDDYDVKDKEGKLTGEKASGVDKINSWEDPNEAPKVAPKSAMSQEELNTRKSMLKNLFDMKALSQEGYDLAIKQLDQQAMQH